LGTVVKRQSAIPGHELFMIDASRETTAMAVYHKTQFCGSDLLSAPVRVVAALSVELSVLEAVSPAAIIWVELEGLESISVLGQRVNRLGNCVSPEIGILLGLEAEPVVETMRRVVLLFRMLLGTKELSAGLENRDACGSYLSDAFDVFREGGGLVTPRENGATLMDSEAEDEPEYNVETADDEKQECGCKGKGRNMVREDCRSEAMNRNMVNSRIGPFDSKLLTKLASRRGCRRRDQGPGQEGS
jgi:hypothetical protein